MQDSTKRKAYAFLISLSLAFCDISSIA